MGRRAGANKKNKSNQRADRNEMSLAGDYIQQIGDPRGLALDQDIAAYARKPVEEVIHSPFGGFADIAGPTNNA